MHVCAAHDLRRKPVPNLVATHLHQQRPCSNAPKPVFSLQTRGHAICARWRARFFLCRDTGIAEATNGKVIAHLVKANIAPETGTGWHKHEADFQIVIMTKGWAKNSAAFQKIITR